MSSALPGQDRRPAALQDGFSGVMAGPYVDAGSGSRTGSAILPSRRMTFLVAQVDLQQCKSRFPVGREALRLCKVTNAVGKSD
jgi:hypothetical protein